MPNLVATVLPTAPPKPPVIGAKAPENAPVAKSCPKSFIVYFLSVPTVSRAFTPALISAPLAVAAATPTAIDAPPVNGAAATAAV